MNRNGLNFTNSATSSFVTSHFPGLKYKTKKFQKERKKEKTLPMHKDITYQYQKHPSRKGDLWAKLFFLCWMFQDQEEFQTKNQMSPIFGRDESIQGGFP